ncbi:MAG: DUF4359 domain-containing protein [Bacillota bacterium]
MSKGQFMIIFLLGLAILMAITNPGMDDYANWAADDLVEEDSGLESFVAGIIGEPIIKRMTTRNNYVVFSIYITRASDSGDVWEARTLGILGNFFVLEERSDQE